MLSLYLLGAFRFESDGQAIRLSTHKVESLLAYLALHPDVHSREKLAALFWGDVSDAQARASLRNALPILRKHLGSDVLITDRETIQLRLTHQLWVDALDLKAQAAALLTTALPDPNAMDIELYQGDLLADFYDEWIAPERDAYRALYLNVLLRLARQLQAQAEYMQAIRLATKMLALETTHEAAYQLLMSCYLALDDRQSALLQYETCRRVLHDELGVEPQSETTALYQQIRQAAPLHSTLDVSVGNLPFPLTSFVGRAQELEALQQILTPIDHKSGTRLLTLTGPGGAGKTRLAIRAAREATGRFADGLWWVELAALSDAMLVSQTVAKTLGLRESPGEAIDERLLKHLRSKQALVILDNCEHLIGACAQIVDRLLQGCPRLQILCTSREALGITGEIVWLVPPLSLADEVQSEAARLFVERAMAVKPSFVLTPQNASIVEQICQRLDGIPLAIELAAARVKMLSVEQIAARLNDRFKLLTGGSRMALPRQQTLRAAIDWSHTLLDAAEQMLFRRLAVFAGGFTLDAVQAITADVDVLDTLSRLVDKSLVIAGESRYQMLETIRHYGADKLSALDEEDLIRRRHLQWVSTLAERAEPELQGAKQAQWFDELETEHDNIRAALLWATEHHEVEMGLRLCGALWQFWGSRGYMNEGRERLAKLWALPAADQPTVAQAKALIAAGGLHMRQGDFANAQPYFEKSMRVWHQLDQPAGIALALHYLGWVANAFGEYARARSLYEQSLAMRRELGVTHQREVAESLANLGMLAFFEGHYETARRIQEESVSIKRALGEQWGLTFSLHNLGNACAAMRDFSSAQKYLAEGLGLAQTLKDQVMTSYLLESFACLAVIASLHGSAARYLRAARLFGAAEALRETISSPLPPQWSAYCARLMAYIDADPDQESIRTAWSEGRSFSPEQAIASALEV